jgi:hypothetical protein
MLMRPIFAMTHDHAGSANGRRPYVWFRCVVQMCGSEAQPIVDVLRMLDRLAIIGYIHIYFPGVVMVTIRVPSGSYGSLHLAGPPCAISAL